MDFILCLLLLDDMLKAVSPCGIRVQNVGCSWSGIVWGGTGLKRTRSPPLSCIHERHAHEPQPDDHDYTAASLGIVARCARIHERRDLWIATGLMLTIQQGRQLAAEGTHSGPSRVRTTGSRPAGDPARLAAFCRGVPALVGRSRPVCGQGTSSACTGASVRR